MVTTAPGIVRDGSRMLNRGSLARRCADLSVPKIKFDNNGDEVRLGPARM